MNLQGESVLVTGASGFIGTRLCLRLQQQGAVVHGLSRTRPAGADEHGVFWWQGRVTDAADVATTVTATRPAVIFHVAGHTQAARGPEQVVPTMEANLISTINVLTSAQARGCPRVVLTGSLEEPASADPLVVPSSPYAASKWAASAYGRMFHALYGLDVVMLRVFMVYGPGQHDVRKLIPSVILALLRGETPKLGSGQRPVDWIHVDDVAAAYVAAGQQAGIGGMTFDVGSGELVTVRALIEQLTPMVSSTAAVNFGALPDRPLEQVRVADTAPATAALGWRPTVPLRAGLQSTVEWYRHFAPGR